MKDKLKALAKKFGPDLAARAKAHLDKIETWEYVSLTTVAALVVLLVVSAVGYFYP